MKHLSDIVADRVLNVGLRLGMNIPFYFGRWSDIILQSEEKRKAAGVIAAYPFIALIEPYPYDDDPRGQIYNAVKIVVVYDTQRKGFYPADHITNSFKTVIDDIVKEFTHIFTGIDCELLSYKAVNYIEWLRDNKLAFNDEVDGTEITADIYVFDELCETIQESVIYQVDEDGALIIDDEVENIYCVF